MLRQVGESITGSIQSRILKHISTSPPLFQKVLSKCFQGFFAVLEAKWHDFYIINRKKTHEKPPNHLCPRKIVMMRRQGVSEYGPEFSWSAEESSIYTQHH